MAKKSQESVSFASNIKILIGVVIAVAIVWGAWEKYGDIQDSLSQYVENSDILTMESQFTPEQLMESHRAELLGNTQKTYREPILKYYPYLLMEVKFTENKKSRAGVLLWGMADGEIVLNTDNWEKTEGFKDCLECQASRSDFMIIHTLVKHQGALTVDAIQKELNVEHDTLETWLATAVQKHLLVRKGNLVQLHFENPKIIALPQTKIKQNLVSKPALYAQKVGKSYSKSQIIQIAKATFGPDFSIRSEQEVYLPVYRLEVQNQDGSIYATEWNAITGRILTPSYQISLK